MTHLQNGMDQLSPMAALPTISIIFFIASVAGWYIGDIIEVNCSASSRSN